MVILVDMDNVLDDLAQAWIDCLNKKHGTEVSEEDVVDWDIGKLFPTIPTEDIYKPLQDDEFWKTVRPKDGAAEALRSLLEEGNEVYVVTSSSYKALASKMENVLFKYFPFLTWDNVIVTSNKQLVRGDVLVDDAIHNLVGGSYLQILMDAPYNRSIDDRALGIRRAYNWSDVKKYIYAHEKKISGDKACAKGV